MYTVVTMHMYTVFRLSPGSYVYGLYICIGIIVYICIVPTVYIRWQYDQ